MKRLSLFILIILGIPPQCLEALSEETIKQFSMEESQRYIRLLLQAWKDPLAILRRSGTDYELYCLLAVDRYISLAQACSDEDKKLSCREYLFTLRKKLLKLSPSSRPTQMLLQGILGDINQIEADTDTFLFA